MKRSTNICSIVCLTFLCLPVAYAGSQRPSTVDQPKKAEAAESYGRLPLSFEANQGQSDARVKFLSRGSGYSLFLTGNEAVLALKRPEKKAAPGMHLEPASLTTRKAKLQSEAVLRMRLVGANAAAPVTGLEEQPGRSNYFIGNDSSKWRTNVPNYAKVKYANVYPGVDLVYYGNQRQLEFDLVVQPGGDPKSVKLEFGKHAALRIDGQGDLVVGPAGEQVLFHKPVVYQAATNDGTRKMIDGKFVLAAAHQVRFQIAAYDRSRALVIDPTLAYSTYLGGSDVDYGSHVVVDRSGNAYVTGSTFSTNFPVTSGAFQTTCASCGSAFGSRVIFVSKLNATGSALLYSTYLGGSFDLDSSGGIAVDGLGNAYVTGGTNSADFPITPGAFQSKPAGAFVSKLNARGSALVYSTYLGGGVDQGNGIAIDASGNAYVTGGTNSADFPVTPGAFQTTFGGTIFVGDAFVSKLNAAGSALIYSTYLGGRGDDQGNGIAIDASGNAYVIGSTDSSNFPTTAGTFQTTYVGDGNAFVSKLNAAGSALVYSTYLGGGGEFGTGIAIDAFGNAYLTGQTTSANFPTTAGAFQTTLNGSYNAFVSKLNPSGSHLLYSTYLGGGGGSGGESLAVDASGNADIAGFTGFGFPTTPDALKKNLFSGGFFSKLNPTGSTLLYSTFLNGSDGTASANGIAVDTTGNVYLAGQTTATDFPTTQGAFQTKSHDAPNSRGIGGDAFVSKFSFRPSTPGADLFLRVRPSARAVVQGELLTYAFPVWNLGTVDASHEVLTTQVPQGTTFDSIRISGTRGLGTCTHPAFGATGRIVCHENSVMEDNTTWTVRLTVRVTAPSGTVITESALATEDTFDPNLANNIASASVTVH